MTYTDRQARALVAAIIQKREHLAHLTRELEIAEMTHNADATRRHTVTAIYQHPERLANVLPMFHHTDTHTRDLVLYFYHLLLRHMLEAALPGDKPKRVNFDALPLASRPYLLGPYLGLVVGNAFPRLDLDRSHPQQGQLTYTHVGGAADPEQWRLLLPRASAWLGGNWKLHTATATTITLIRRAELPKSIAMQRSYLRRGALFVGLDTDTNQPAYIPFVDMTSGTFVVGSSGSGKSNATHILMQSILANLDLFRIVVCIDGKEGMTFDRYLRIPVNSISRSGANRSAIPVNPISRMRGRDGAVGSRVVLSVREERQASL